VPACPAGVLVVEPDDDDRPRAAVRVELRRRLAEVCPGRAACERLRGATCHAACPRDAIRHTW